MENNNFKIGDIAVVIMPKCYYYLEECQIMSELIYCEKFYDYNRIDVIDTNCYVYRVIMSNGAGGYYRPQDLRKNPPKDDHREISNWSDSIWKPNLLNKTV